MRQANQIKIVDDTTELVVGKYYNVRCAEMKNREGETTGFIPIIGEKHKDPQFGANFTHYHIDGRFMSEYSGYSVDANGKTNAVLTSEELSYNNSFVSQIVIKRRKCRRLTTGLRPPKNAHRYNDWYDSMVGKSCAGKKCPHLGTMMLEVDGKLICPLHNLEGCMTKEIIVSREAVTK